MVVALQRPSSRPCWKACRMPWKLCSPNLQVREKSRAANATSGRGLRRAVNGPNGTKSFDTSAVLPYRCQHGSREHDAAAPRQCFTCILLYCASSTRISQAACAAFTFFEARSINFAIVVYSYVHACRCATCIEPILWDHGGQHGQESEEGEGKEEDRQEEEVGFAATLLRHVKARARLCHRKADIAAA